MEYGQHDPWRKGWWNKEGGKSGPDAQGWCLGMAHGKGKFHKGKAGGRASSSTSLSEHSGAEQDWPGSWFKVNAGRVGGPAFE